MKRILDACCGSRMFWFDKENPDVVFQDIRRYEDILCDGRTLRIDPDVIGDFRDMDFPSETFNLVIFDPPHMFLGENSYMAKKYGRLNPYTWREDIRMGFEECFRVLKENGVLIFKWSENNIKVSEILKLTPHKPLFGHKTASKTIWIAFMK